MPTRVLLYLKTFLEIYQTSPNIFLIHFVIDFPHKHVGTSAKGSIYLHLLLCIFTLLNGNKFFGTLCLNSFRGSRQVWHRTCSNDFSHLFTNILFVPFSSFCLKEHLNKNYLADTCPNPSLLSVKHVFACFLMNKIFQNLVDHQVLKFNYTDQTENIFCELPLYITRYIFLSNSSRCLYASLLSEHETASFVNLRFPFEKVCD